MFLRPLVELSGFVSQQTGADDVEVYYRCLFSERKTTGIAAKRNGVRAFTRVRWQRAEREWSVGFGGFLPSLQIMKSLIDLSSPGRAGIGIPMGRLEKKVSVSPSRDEGCNLTGWFRDFLVTTSGIHLSAEGEFAFFEDAYGLWNEKPKWTELQDRGENLILSPQVTLVLLEAGLLKGIACRKPVRGFLHNVFDQIGDEPMNWCRTPDDLEVLSAAVGLAVQRRNGCTGRICDRALVDTGKRVHLFSGNTKICTLSQSMLKSIKKVSDEYQLFRNRSMFQLPWIELKGGAEWESH